MSEQASDAPAGRYVAAGDSPIDPNTVTAGTVSTDALAVQPVKLPAAEDLRPAPPVTGKGSAVLTCEQVGRLVDAGKTAWIGMLVLASLVTLAGLIILIMGIANSQSVDTGYQDATTPDTGLLYTAAGVLAAALWMWFAVLAVTVWRGQRLTHA